MAAPRARRVLHRPAGATGRPLGRGEQARRTGRRRVRDRGGTRVRLSHGTDSRPRTAPRAPPLRRAEPRPHHRAPLGTTARGRTAPVRRWRPPHVPSSITPGRCPGSTTYVPWSPRRSSVSSAPRKSCCGRRSAAAAGRRSPVRRGLPLAAAAGDPRGGQRRTPFPQGRLATHARSAFRARGRWLLGHPRPAVSPRRRSRFRAPGAHLAHDAALQPCTVINSHAVRAPGPVRTVNAC
jgi:hypothetical protein